MDAIQTGQRGWHSFQVLTLPTSGNRFGSAVALDAIQGAGMDWNYFLIDSSNPNRTPFESASGSVSKLDLKAPAKAVREFGKGYQLLLRNDLQGAVQYLASAVSIYPSFVAAHNTLGTTYLKLSQNEQARDQFSKAVALDDHLPNSYLNLGIAQLALKDYPAAEESLRKASSLAPLDAQLSLALAYGEFVNHSYPAVIATAHDLHARQHKGAEVVHFFAAGAWAAQNNLTEAQQEMETLLREDPKSASAGQFRQILEQIKADQTKRSEPKPLQLQADLLSFNAGAQTPEQASRQAQLVMQDVKERSQIAEAEAEPDATCLSCGTAVAGESGTEGGSDLMAGSGNSAGLTLRASVDEVDVFFAATDHGKSVMDLTAADVGVRDASRPPEKILGFRNESQLPLRLGLVIDTSNSVADRFSFEQGAAAKFLETVVTDSSDFGFVVGVNNSVLLAQDFTTDRTLLSRAVSQLAPGGGTALWDAVAFAADKLAGRAEDQPTARVLVVISDGEDNSSGVSLKQAITAAARGEVVIYTVSTRERGDERPSSLLGDQALRTLSELTGGAAFVPGSLGHLKGSLADVQQVIRGRYLITYKPASFHRDGSYRTIDLTAQRNGRQFKVFARKGYYAAAAQPRLLKR
jgi:VWFA-related protein